MYNKLMAYYKNADSAAPLEGGVARPILATLAKGPDKHVVGINSARCCFKRHVLPSAPEILMIIQDKERPSPDRA